MYDTKMKNPFFYSTSNLEVVIFYTYICVIFFGFWVWFKRDFDFM
jgi:hypothetical protein